MMRQMCLVPHSAETILGAHPVQRENHWRYLSSPMAKGHGGQRRQIRRARLTEQFQKKSFDCA